jgi:hypothetical protein
MRWLSRKEAIRLHNQYKAERAKKPMPTELSKEELALLDLRAYPDSDFELPEWED